MVIDCHTHLGKNEHIKAVADELLVSMDQAKVDKSLVFAGELNDCSNKWMLEQIKPYRDRLLPVASVMLFKVYSELQYGTYKDDDMSLGDLQRSIQKGAVAIKLYTGYEHYAPSSKEVRKVLDIADAAKLPVIFHTGDCLNSVHKAKLKYAQPLDIDDIAVDYPNINFIIAHMAYPWVRDAAEVCYKNANVYSDFSGFVYGEFEGSDVRKFSNSINSFLDIAGNDKLLFGTDWPISNQSSYVKTVETLFEQSLCPAPEFLSQNVRRAFKLP